MIRKMRENSNKKNMPMAAPDELRLEAPGLRVGATAWKWPPVWPYDTSFFKRKVELDADVESKKNGGAGAGGLLGGMGGMMNSDVSSVGIATSMNGSSDGADTDTAVEKVMKTATLFDSLKYWNEKHDVLTDLDERVAERIANHYSFYLNDGISILELGAAEQSYLPSDIKPRRHVGVGAVQSQMDANPSITESLVLDLNRVVEDEGLDSVEFDILYTNSSDGQLDDDDRRFDAVIMANTIDFLNHPREVFKSAWRALKPGGIMIVPFLTKDAYAEKFGEAFTKQWRDMTDDQHMWVCGSFFQFSAGEGWDGLKGFDISHDDARKEETNGQNLLAKLQNKSNDDKPPGAFVVQARKDIPPDAVSDNGDVESFIRSRLWMMSTLEDRDKKLVAPRLARAYESIDSSDDRELMVHHIDSLPKVYASLIKMDQFAFTFSMQAQLAADLVGDPCFNGNDAQIANLKMGLGLRKPSKEFWAPVGKSTSAMTPEDKVNLLAHIVPRFGSGNPDQDRCLEAFVSGLQPTFAIVRSKCSGMSEGDVQLLGSELLAAEVLKPERSTRKQFALWLGALTDVDLHYILTKRKGFKEEARRELESFRERREADERRTQEKREKIQVQVIRARETRSVFFNPRTGKMEEVAKKGGGFKLPF